MADPYLESMRHSEIPDQITDRERNENHHGIELPGLAPMEGTEQAVKPDTSKAWETLLDAVTRYDDGMIEGYTSSMNNLLIFAGLFSAVVTAFVIESYSSLQENPADKSNDLLTQISLQLSSFSVNSAYINSTTPSFTSTTTPGFRPPLLAVRINILWFLSLSASLIAALFAILVQQWLQEYRYRGIASVRESLRLRQLRFDSLSRWGVHDIVAVLPVLLQLALVLFLAGLLILLWSLNEVVAIAVTVFLAIPLLLFLSTALFPLFHYSCPYKSPMTTMILTSWWLAEFATFAVSLRLYSMTIYLVAYLLRLRKFCFGWEHGNLQLLLEKLLSRQLHMFTRRRESSFARLASRTQWVAYDMRELKSAKANRFDLSDAMTWAPHAISGSMLSQLDHCLLDLTRAVRCMCVLNWTVLAFNFDGLHLISKLDFLPYSRTVDNAIFERRHNLIREENVIIRHRRLLLESFPPPPLPGTAGRTILPYVGLVTLATLRHLLPIGPPADYEFLENYSTALKTGRTFVNAKSRFFNASDDRLRILARCYLDLWTKLGWNPTSDDTDDDSVISRVTATVPTATVQEHADDIPQWAVECTMKAYPRSDVSVPYDFERHDGVICALAVGFLYVERSPHAVKTPANILALSEALQRFLVHEKMAIVHSTHMSLDAHPGNTAFSTPVWPTILKSLAFLARRGPSALQSDMVISIVDDLSPVFAKGNEHLRSLVPQLEHVRGLYARGAYSHSLVDSTHTGWQLVDVVYMNAVGTASLLANSIIHRPPARGWKDRLRRLARFVKSRAYRIAGRPLVHTGSAEDDEQSMSWTTESSHYETHDEGTPRRAAELDGGAIALDDEGRPSQHPVVPSQSDDPVREPESSPAPGPNVVVTGRQSSQLEGEFNIESHSPANTLSASAKLLQDIALDQEGILTTRSPHARGASGFTISPAVADNSSASPSESTESAIHFPRSSPDAKVAAEQSVDVGVMPETMST